MLNRILLLIAFNCSVVWLQAQSFPLVHQGHSHNDYTRSRPLFDALDNGFMSVEIDVFLRNGDIMVAHTSLGIRQGNTLRNLYLEPLKQRVAENNGCVYAGEETEFVIMIDLKDHGNDIMDELHKQLADYSDMFTKYVKGKKEKGAIRVVLSGGPDAVKVMSFEPRYMSMDEHVSGFNRERSTDVSPRVSASYGSIFNWKGKGKIPADEKQTLQQLVAEAHKYGKKVRFWATPQKETIWREQLDAGVDWLNIDDLARFRKFYLAYKGNKKN